MHFLILFFFGLMATMAEKDDFKKEKELEKKELEAIAGNYKIIEMVMDGKAENIENRSIIFTKTEMIMMMGETRANPLTYRIDPTKKPKTLDVRPVNDNQFIYGIYSSEKNKMKICLNANPGGDRPDEFESKSGSKFMLLILEKK
jgi:uncharacterized protein (TIGR03067 family)